MGPTVGKKKKKKKVCFSAEHIFRLPIAAAVNDMKIMIFLSMPEQSINRMLFLQENSYAVVVAYIKLTLNVFLC